MQPKWVLPEAWKKSARAVATDSEPLLSNGGATMHPGVLPKTQNLAASATIATTVWVCLLEAWELALEGLLPPPLSPVHATQGPGKQPLAASRADYHHSWCPLVPPRG